MIECEAVVKKWGNSIGIILPRLIVKNSGISADDKVKVVVTKLGTKNVAKKLWGSLPNWKTPSDDLERFVDKEFDLPP